MNRYLATALLVLAFCFAAFFAGAFAGAFSGRVHECPPTTANQDRIRIGGVTISADDVDGPTVIKYIGIILEVGPNDWQVSPKP